MATKLKWLYSHQTILFDTPDGDIDKGQFCRFNEGFLIRSHPKNNETFQFVTELDTTGMEEVFIADERGAYYDYFSLPGNRKLRVPSSKGKYEPLSKVKNYPQPSKEVEDVEIAEITKDDELWR